GRSPWAFSSLAAETALPADSRTALKDVAIAEAGGVVLVEAVAVEGPAVHQADDVPVVLAQLPVEAGFHRVLIAVAAQIAGFVDVIDDQVEILGQQVIKTRDKAPIKMAVVLAGLVLIEEDPAAAGRIPCQPLNLIPADHLQERVGMEAELAGDQGLGDQT